MRNECTTERCEIYCRSVDEQEFDFFFKLLGSRLQVSHVDMIIKGHIVRLDPHFRLQVEGPSSRREQGKANEEGGFAEVTSVGVANNVL